MGGAVVDGVDGVVDHRLLAQLLHGLWQGEVVVAGPNPGLNHQPRLFLSKLGAASQLP